MTRMISIALALVLATLLSAQELKNLEKPPLKVDVQQMDEDIEVLRRLIMRPLAERVMVDCRNCHSNAMNLWNNVPVGQGKHLFDFSGNVDGSRSRVADSVWLDLRLAAPHHTHGEMPTHFIEGTHMPGHGVIYHMVLPAEKDPARLTPVSESKKVSAWEEEQKLLRGEKVSQPQPARPPSLADILLRVLAENGRYFRQLGAEEQIRVVVTFRGPPTSRASGVTGSGVIGVAGLAGVPGILDVRSGSGSGVGGGPTGSSSEWGQTKPNLTPSGNRDSGGITGPGAGLRPDTPGSVDLIANAGRDQELLGDLHIKQGKYEEAISSYQQAIGIVAEVRTDDRMAERKRIRLATLTYKLALAYLAVGKLEQVQKILKAAAESGAASEPIAKSTSPRWSSVPIKLQVAVSKKELDAVGNGALTFEEFRKKATVTLSGGN